MSVPAFMTHQECLDDQTLLKAGYCPCCGSDIEPFEDFEPVAIGEGVRICGFCVYRRHDADDVAPIILATMLVCRGH